MTVYCKRWSKSTKKISFTQYSNACIWFHRLPTCSVMTRDYSSIKHEKKPKISSKKNDDLTNLLRQNGRKLLI